MPTPRKAWIVWAGFWALDACLAAMTTLYLLWKLRFWDAFFGVLGVQTAYWFALGGWLRTPWGQPHLEEYRRPGPPELGPGFARAYVGVAAACAAAVVLALAWQWFSVR